MVTMLERTEGHYEIQELEFGRVYRWCPESVVIQCECGERVTLTSSTTTCYRCGLDHAAVAWEELADRRLRDEALHPWRYAREREGAGLPY